jgi:hypothetical protein
MFIPSPIKSRSRSLLLLLALSLLSGCTRTYVMSLTNGGRIVSAGKPKLEGGHYVYKDVTGAKFIVPAGRVTEIAPASMSQSEFSTGERSGFLPK